MRTSIRRLSRISSRKAASIAITTIMIMSLVPEQAAAAMLQSAGKSVRAGGAHLWAWLAPAWVAWEGKTGDEESRERNGVRPLPPQSKAEREAQIASIELNVNGEIELTSRQPILLMAVPVDLAGRAIHGIKVQWVSSNNLVVFVRKSGEALGGLPGEATITARAGGKSATVRVTVVDGTRDPFGGRKRVDSTRRSQEQARGRWSTRNSVVAQKRTARQKRAHAVSRLAGLSAMMPFIRDPNDDPLPDNETSSLYEPNNLIGAPPGKTRPAAMTAASAVAAAENGKQKLRFWTADRRLARAGNGCLTIVNLQQPGVEQID